MPRQETFEIPEATLQDWQRIADLLAEVTNVPALP